MGGAFDRESFALAQGLISSEGSVWELGSADARFRSKEAGAIAVVGGRATVTVDQEEFPDLAALPVRADSRIHVSVPRRGARVYVAYSPHASTIRKLSEPPASLIKAPFRVVAGPQASLLGLERLANPFQVDFASNRIGIRLEGDSSPHSIELPSEPACVGAIQITGSGQPIVLGPDGPTIGGYPKVAVVIDADLDRLAQLCPGDTISFEVVDFEKAHRLRVERHKRIATWLANLRVTRSM